MAELRGSRPRAGAVALALLMSSAHGLAAAQPAASPPLQPSVAPSASPLAQPSPTSAAAAAAPGAVDAGRRLFEGSARFQNGGPPCGACHAIATLPFPNGGTVGPDLSGVAQTLGPEGTDATLQTLFFPTMLPLYQQRPLTPPEQQALKAFLSQASGASGRDRDTALLAALALVGSLVLTAAAWLAGRGRLRSVRAPLVERARRGGARP